MERQKAIERYFRNAGGDNVYVLLCGFLRGDMRGQSAPQKCMALITEHLREIGGGDIYLAGGRVFIAAVLHDEFPELSLFDLRPDEAFTNSQTVPGFWMETRRFHSLCGLAQMRRELQRTPLPMEADEVIKVLLGLAPAPRIGGKGTPK